MRSENICLLYLCVTCAAFHFSHVFVSSPYEKTILETADPLNQKTKKFLMARRRLCSHAALKVLVSWPTRSQQIHPNPTRQHTYVTPAHVAYVMHAPVVKRYSAKTVLTFVSF